MTTTESSVGDIKKILGMVGFDAVETDVYLTLLQAGGLSAAMLAKRRGLPRTTVYTMLQRLIARGLVRESTRKGLKVFSGEPPDSLLQLFTERIGTLETAREQFARLLPRLRAMHTPLSSTPKVMVMEGQEGLRNVLRDMLRYANLDTCAVWPIRKTIEVLSGDFLQTHNIERIKRNISIRTVWPVSEVVSIEEFPFLGWGKEFKREIRVAPSTISYSLGYWIYANKVAFLSSSEEGSGYIIESAELVETLRAQFELLWNVSSPLKFDPAVVQKFITKLNS